MCIHPPRPVTSHQHAPTHITSLSTSHLHIAHAAHLHSLCVHTRPDSPSPTHMHTPHHIPPARGRRTATADATTTYAVLLLLSLPSLHRYRCRRCTATAYPTRSLQSVTPHARLGGVPFLRGRAWTLALYLAVTWCSL